MSPSMTPGQTIREARLAKGLSLGQLASAVGRTASSVRRWEKDEAYPTSAVLDQLSEMLDIERDVLEPDGRDTSATGGEAVYDVPAVFGTTEEAAGPPSGEILSGVQADEEAEDATNGTVVDVVIAGEVDAQPVITEGARLEEPSISGGEVGVESQKAEDAEPEELSVPSVGAESEPVLAPPPTVDPAAATMPVAVPQFPVDGAPSTTEAGEAESTVEQPGLVDEETEALLYPVPPKKEPAAGPPPPPVQRTWWNPLRPLRQGDQQWRYYLRGALTVIVLLLLAWGLVWAFGELSTALSDLWDTFGRTSDTSEGQAAASLLSARPG